LGVSDFNILGRGSNNERTITFALSDTAWAATSKVVSISSSYFNPASRDIITYCNILGNAFSPSSVIAPVVYTAAGIYLGDPFPVNPTGLASALYGPNLNNNINNNFIGGVKTGIYWGAKDSVTDQLNNINYNIIGGSMTVPGGRGRVYLIGGAVNQSGIYIKGLSTSTIDSNIVRNSHNSFTGFAGIFLNGSATIGRSKDLIVTKNTIYNLGCAAANIGYAVGIRVGVNEANRSIRIQNNFITKIYGAGGNNFSTVSAPSGIAVFMDPAMTPGTAVINLGLNISHNTINLPQYPGLDIGASQYTAAFFVGDRVAGLRVINNIFANTAGKSSYGAAASTVAAIAFGGTRLVTTDAFSQIEGNVYYANGRFCANYVGLKNGVNVLANNVLQTITELKAYAGFDNLSSFGEVPFLNDTTIQMNPYYIGHIVKNPDIFTEATVDKDITGAARPAGVNNTSVGALHINPSTAYEPLYGGYTYQVTGVLNPPSAGQQTGQFNTINNLFRYINTNGVDEDQFPIKTVTIEITSGYAGEGDTAIFPLMKYPQMSPFRFIYIKPAAGASPVIASTGATNASAVDGITSVIKIQGARNVTIDGSNNGSNSRDLTVRMALPTGGNALNIQSQAARVIDVMGWERPAEDNVIKNCNIIGNSTISGINTYAGIYQGGINNFGTVNNNVPTNSIRIANSRNAYVNNYITAVKHGIYLRGGVAATASDVGVTVSQNIIGGNNNIGGALPTDYFGGGAVVSPSFMYASAIAAFTQTQLTIDSNIIQNSLSAIPGTNPVLGNAGIEIGAASSKVKISRNIITRIRATNTASTLLSAGACGIYVNVPWTEKRSINIENNMISRIVGTVNNTYGICLDGSPNTTNDIDVNIYHNSINLSNLDTTSGIAACIGGSAFAKGDIRIENNILQNRMVRVTPNTANYIFHSTYTSGNPFLAVDNNNYFVSGPNATNNMALIGTTTVASFVNWVNYTKQDTLSLNYPAPFTNENNLFIPAATTSPLYLGGRKIPTILTDILGTVRPAGLSATIGAHDFSGNGFFADSMAPKLYDYTPLPDYCNGDFNPIIVKARVLDRNPVLR
ncbi:MAG: hypothetical protein V4658_12635, partial [Bacteroidota bacterium]